MSIYDVRLQFDRIFKVTSPTKSNPDSKLLLIRFVEMDYDGTQTYTWAPKWEHLLKLTLQSLIVEAQNHPEKTDEFGKALRGFRSMQKMLVKKSS